MTTNRKHAFAATALALAIGLGGLATADATTTAPAAAASSASPFTDDVVHVDRVKLTATDQASKLIGSEVYAADGKKVGDVDDLILDNDHEVVAMTVGVGGFLDMDETYVAVPIKHMTFGMANDKVRLSTDLTKADIEAAAKQPM